ncbi:hypothetical protein [Flavobacterium psychrophilum]|uniref:hypothetical protein n=1 Tax=Flavobacterium psychrophilum TaxID=96345 RepID=UPI00313A0C19
MEKLIITLSLFLVGTSAFVQAQEKPLDVKYRRSSLHTMVVESEKFPQKDVVLKAFNNAPFPEKYNNHQIAQKSFNPANYTLTAEEKAKFNSTSKTAKINLDEPESVDKELPARIQKYFEKEKIAHKLVAKWFNRKADGSFDSNLVSERGVFNASFLDQKTAQASSEGDALLKTAGFELIDNTFVVVNKFNFVENEPVARVIRDAAKIAASKLPMGQEVAMRLADKAYDKAKEGYSIWATSYLYKLVWNETVSNTFYADLYMDKTNLDPAKKKAFDNSDLFKLEFVGDESASALVTFSLKENRTEEQIIALSTVRITDNVYAKLQKKYAVFKTKTPLFTGNPITAKIGTKEGLEGGEKFDVLEQTINEKTGIATYKSIGTIKVEKDLIWDNAYNGTEKENTEATPAIDRTTFSGGKKYYPGLLIRQIK